MTITGGIWFLARFYPLGAALKKTFFYMVYFVLFTFKHRTFKELYRGLLDTALGLPAVLRGRRVVSPETVRILESKPYETSLIKYGSYDTVRKWVAGRRVGG